MSHMPSFVKQNIHRQSILHRRANVLVWRQSEGGEHGQKRALKTQNHLKGMGDFIIHPYPRKNTQGDEQL